MTENRRVNTYMFDQAMWDRLQNIKKRLYDDRPLSNDKRRDLANAFDALMHMVWVDRSQQ